MSQHKPDEPFGLLPKRTAMDLDSVGGLFSMPLPRDFEPRRPDLADSQDADEAPKATSKNPARPWQKPV